MLFAARARDSKVSLLAGYKRVHFTITAEIHARSLVNFYSQYADASARESGQIRPFVIVKNKLMSVFNESVLLLTMNFGITLSK